MTEQEGRFSLYQAEADNLRQLAEFLPDGDPNLYEFSTLLAARLVDRREISPFTFVLYAQCLIEDFRSGIADLTGQPMKGALVGLPKAGYVLLTNQIPKIARAIYPEDFADQVDSILQE